MLRSGGVAQGRPAGGDGAQADAGSAQSQLRRQRDTLAAVAAALLAVNLVLAGLLAAAWLQPLGPSRTAEAATATSTGMPRLLGDGPLGRSAAAAVAAHQRRLAQSLLQPDAVAAAAPGAGGGSGSGVSDRLPVARRAAAALSLDPHAADGPDDVIDDVTSDGGVAPAVADGAGEAGIKSAAVRAAAATADSASSPPPPPPPPPPSPLQGRSADSGLPPPPPPTCPLYRTTACTGPDIARRPPTCYPASPNLFEDLTVAETDAVAAYMAAHYAELGLVGPRSGVLSTEVYVPPKAQVLEYLDAAGPAPLRAARVHALIFAGGAAGDAMRPSARIALRVWPLPEPTAHERLPVVRDLMEVPWVNNTMPENAASSMEEQVLQLSMGGGLLAPIVGSLYSNASLSGSCISGCMMAGSASAPLLVPVPPGSNDTAYTEAAGQRYKLYQVWAFERSLSSQHSPPGWYLHRLYLLQFIFEVLPPPRTPQLRRLWLMGQFFDTPRQLRTFWDTGVWEPAAGAPAVRGSADPGVDPDPDPDSDPLWRHLDWEFDPAQHPERVTEMLASWKQVHVPKLDASPGRPPLYSSFDRRPGPVRGTDSQPVGPLTYEPYGQRFNVSRNKVAWMGWSLQVSMGQAGPRYWNVAFKGERVLFELSVQEAVAGYGSPDPATSSILYFDSATYHMGYDTRQLTNGVDCPLHAAYMTLVVDGKPVKRALCIFEHDTTVPLLAHHPQTSAGGGAVRGTALVLRVRTTVANYDYYHQVLLHMDGTIWVETFLTGYLMGTSTVPGSADYARYAMGPVARYMSGALHDHSMVWKVDIDVAGTSNAVMLSQVKPERWRDFAGRVWTSKYIEHRMAETENDTALVFEPSQPRHLHLINRNATNRWGAARGYALHLRSLHSNVLPQDTPELRARAWAKYHVAVTVRKDSEWTCSLEPDSRRPAHPSLDFDSYLDGESVVDQDLVAWVVGGTYHMPRAEDNPVTPTSMGPAAGFVLAPYNYLDENGAMDARDLWSVPPHAPNMSDPALLPPLQRFVGERANLCAPRYEQMPLFTED